MIELTTGVAFLMSSMYGIGAPAVATAVDATPSTPTTTETQMVVNDRKAVEKYLREKFADTPILVEIARCESTFTQFDKDGNVIRGIVNNKDVGVMQINEKFHAENAKKLGYDLYTLDGNAAYGQYLYKRDGAAPWKASSKCWGAVNS